MKGIYFIVLLASCFALQSEELPKELYMPNDAGGFIVVTVEDCSIERVKETFPNRAYATEVLEDGSEVIHEGCWESAKDMPNDPRFFNVFNIFFEPNIVATYPHYDFSPEKKRWEEKKEEPQYNKEDLI